MHHCRRFSSILGFYLVDARSTCAALVTTKNSSKHCQMPPVCCGEGMKTKLNHWLNKFWTVLSLLSCCCVFKFIYTYDIDMKTDTNLTSCETYFPKAIKSSWVKSQCTESRSPGPKSEKGRPQRAELAPKAYFVSLENCFTISTAVNQ